MFRAWSQGSPQWKSYPKILRDIELLDHSSKVSSFVSKTPSDHTDSASGTSDEGVFWISIVDFCRLFNAMHVCAHPPSSAGHAFTFEGEWSAATAGGSWHHKTWLNNPQYAIDIESNGEIMVSLRRLPDANYDEPRLRSSLKSTTSTQHVPVRRGHAATNSHSAGQFAIGFIVLRHSFTPGSKRYVPAHCAHSPEPEPALLLPLHVQQASSAELEKSK